VLVIDRIAQSDRELAAAPVPPLSLGLVQVARNWVDPAAVADIRAALAAKAAGAGKQLQLMQLLCGERFQPWRSYGKK
jgi:hypothetical protein